MSSKFEITKEKKKTSAPSDRKINIENNVSEKYFSSLYIGKKTSAPQYSVVFEVGRPKRRGYLFEGALIREGAFIWEGYLLVDLNICFFFYLAIFLF